MPFADHLVHAERKVLLRIAEVATPVGRRVPVPDDALVTSVERLVERFDSRGVVGYRVLVRALDLAAVPLTGRRLSQLPTAKRAAALERLARHDTTSALVQAVAAPIKAAQARAIEATPARTGLSVVAGEARQLWEEQLVDGRTLKDEEELEVDCVVVGTGAGGAPMAHALAARGYAVVMIEAGGHFTRRDFEGDLLERYARLYWKRGMTGAIGNTFIPVPLGRTVGGSTTVNSGTCYRPPDATLRRWQLTEGLHELGPGSLDPYLDKVETMLEVAPANADALGGCARVIARGAEALGYEHGPLRRNAQGCDAQGACCFGCPTDAKRSTNVTYVPRALARGAMLYSHCTVREVMLEGGRAVGVVADTPEGGVLRVRARAVVLAAGAVGTPALLLRQGLANSSKQVGRNLTIHPASYAWAEFDETVDGLREIPQGYAVDEFADQGIRFEGSFPPFPIAAGSLAPVGHEWTAMMDRFEQFACFGFMITDSARGSVALGPGGAPQMFYRMADEDVRRMVRAQAILARIYFAGGARAVYPALRGFGELKGLEDVERLEREGPARARAHHLALSAYHPLGTCRMGPDPSRSVIGPSHECWDVPGLFVVDGAAVPGPLGVNPQLTIMALSERAAEHVARRVDAGARVRAVVAEGAKVSFEETMAGRCAFSEEEGGAEVDVSFTVKAIGALSLERAWAERGGSWALTGTIEVPGHATARPCQGVLEMKPLRRRGTLVYDLDFEDDQGRPCTLHGEKHATLRAGLSGMTTLYTTLRREGALVASGTLYFDLDDLAPWLASWRLAAG